MKLYSKLCCVVGHLPSFLHALILQQCAPLLSEVENKINILFILFICIKSVEKTEIFLVFLGDGELLVYSSHNFYEC